MSDNYGTIPTSREVWAVIRARHESDLRLHSTYSSPETGEMMTQYSLNGSDFPLIGARTRWDVDCETPHKRINEQHEFWLCVPRESAE